MINGHACLKVADGMSESKGHNQRLHVTLRKTDTKFQMIPGS